MIPCKDCLVLAICRHKKHVVCNLLFNWLGKEYRHYIHEHIPDVLSVTTEDPQDLTIKVATRSRVNLSRGGRRWRWTKIEGDED